MKGQSSEAWEAVAVREDYQTARLNARNTKDPVFSGLQGVS